MKFWGTFKQIFCYCLKILKDGQCAWLHFCIRGFLVSSTEKYAFHKTNILHFPTRYSKSNKNSTIKYIDFVFSVLFLFLFQHISLNYILIIFRKGSSVWTILLKYWKTKICFLCDSIFQCFFVMLRRQTQILLCKLESYGRT